MAEYVVCLYIDHQKMAAILDFGGHVGPHQSGTEV